jgi:ADP-ribosylglycohydrolase
MRTSGLGVINYQNLEIVKKNTKKICLVTHYYPRCLASCIALTTISNILNEKYYNSKTKKFNIKKLIEEAAIEGKKYLDCKLENFEKEFKEYLWENEIENLKLDDKKNIGYSFKCLGSAFYGFFIFFIN